jgi:hypothetical protein
MNFDAFEVEGNILQLLSGQRVSECNIYLQEFTDSPCAWAVTTQLFASTNDSIKFFAANILYIKVGLPSRVMICFEMFNFTDSKRLGSFGVRKPPESCLLLAEFI